MRLNADALKLPAVAVPNVMPRKDDAQAARQDEVGDIAVRAIGWRTGIGVSVPGVGSAVV